MTPRTALSLFLLLLIFPVQEFWQLWKNSNREVNWWITLNYPTSIQWYFKDLGTVLAKLLMAVVIYRITFKIQALRFAAIVVLIYFVVEFVFFFVNYNRAAYALIYSTIAPVSLLVIYWRNISKWFRDLFNRHHKTATQ